jgi:hypothetical protein
MGPPESNVQQIHAYHKKTVSITRGSPAKRMEADSVSEVLRFFWHCLTLSALGLELGVIITRQLRTFESIIIDVLIEPRYFVPDARQCLLMTVPRGMILTRTYVAGKAPTGDKGS